MTLLYRVLNHIYLILIKGLVDIKQLLPDWSQLSCSFNSSFQCNQFSSVKKPKSQFNLCTQHLAGIYKESLEHNSLNISSRISVHLVHSQPGCPSPAHCPVPQTLTLSPLDWHQFGLDNINSQSSTYSKLCWLINVGMIILGLFTDIQVIVFTAYVTYDWSTSRHSETTDMWPRPHCIWQWKCSPMQVYDSHASISARKW